LSLWWIPSAPPEIICHLKRENLKKTTDRQDGSTAGEKFNMTRKSTVFYYSGIDIGSTTVKVVIINKEGELVFSRYCRHQGKTMETTRNILEEALQELGDIELDLALTGSAGNGDGRGIQHPFCSGSGCIRPLHRNNFLKGSKPLSRSAVKTPKSFFR